MSKFIISETEKKRILKMHNTFEKKVLSEQPSFPCVTDEFKNSDIDYVPSDDEGGIFIAAAKTSLELMIKDSKTKFKVTSVLGTPELNRKPADVGMIITPNTTITLCSSDQLLLSGMGDSECRVYLKNGKIAFQQFLSIKDFPMY